MAILVYLREFVDQLCFYCLQGRLNCDVVEKNCYFFKVKHLTSKPVILLGEA